MRVKEIRDRGTVNAVHDDQFEGFLRKLGIYDDVRNGTMKCKFCGTPVNYDHIATVFAESGNIKLVCDKPECMARLSEYLADKNV